MDKYSNDLSLLENELLGSGEEVQDAFGGIADYIDELRAENGRLKAELVDLLRNIQALQMVAEKIEVQRDELRAENGRLAAELDEARGTGWLWDKMSELRISTISFDYGMGMIAAFDFDNEEIAEAETLERIFEIAQEWEINQADTE